MLINVDDRKVFTGSTTPKNLRDSVSGAKDFSDAHVKRDQFTVANLLVSKPMKIAASCISQWHNDIVISSPVNGRL